VSLSNKAVVDDNDANDTTAVISEDADSIVEVADCDNDDEADDSIVECGIVDNDVDVVVDELQIALLSSQMQVPLF